VGDVLLVFSGGEAVRAAAAPAPPPSQQPRLRRPSPPRPQPAAVAPARPPPCRRPVRGLSLPPRPHASWPASWGWTCTRCREAGPAGWSPPRMCARFPHQPRHRPRRRQRSRPRLPPPSSGRPCPSPPPVRGGRAPSLPCAPSTSSRRPCPTLPCGERSNVSTGSIRRAMPVKMAFPGRRFPRLPPGPGRHHCAEELRQRYASIELRRQATPTVFMKLQSPR
jgi:hypothetical protein